MATTLRELLLQRAARLQGRPALSAPAWGTLSYAQLRNRVEGVALGILAQEPPASLYSATGTPWDWAAELAAAASGLPWDPAGRLISPEVLGGPSFNAELGRGPYHARENGVEADTPFTDGLNHGELLTRLRRLNVALGWDHTTGVELPLARLGEGPLRAALWSALFAGAQAILVPPSSEGTGAFHPGRKPLPAPWDSRPFQAFWQP